MTELENIGKKFFYAEELKNETLEAIVIIFCDGIPMGTGIFIGKNLILTAKHVIDNYTSEQITAMQEIGIINEDVQSKVRDYTIYTCNISDNSDMAILLTKEIYDNNLPTINFNYPNINDYCMALSYQKLKMEDDILYRNFVASNGKIIDLYEIKRDNHMVNFPSFCIDTIFTAGMSGGPIFDINSKLCGIVSTGCGDLYSIGTLLHPMLGIKIQLESRGFSLYEMTKTKNYISTYTLNDGIILYNEYLNIYNTNDSVSE